MASVTKEEEEEEEELETLKPTCRDGTNEGWGGLVAYRLGETTPEGGGENELEVRVGDRERDLDLFRFDNPSFHFSMPVISSTSVVPATLDERSASGAESAISNCSSSSEYSSSLFPSDGLATGLTTVVVSTDLRLVLDTGGAESSSTTTNDFCRSRSFHLSVREMARNQSVDCWSAQTVGKGYLEAVTFM